MKESPTLTTQAARWGNSLGVRIPKAMADQLGVREGVRLEIRLEAGQIILSRPACTLEEMTQAITEENRHGETTTGPAMGQEVW